MSAQDYDFTLAANGTQEINSEGRFLYYLSGSAGGLSERIKVKHQASGLQMKLMPGQAFELPADAKMGDSWRIENADSQAAILGTVIVGRGAFKDNRLSGTVSVVDGGRLRSGAGLEYMAYGSVISVANRPYLQIVNPSGSGKRLAVKSVVVASSSATFIAIGRYDAGLTTLVQQTANKLVGGAAGVGQVRSDDVAGFLWASNMGGAQVQANTAFQLGLSSPILVDPGKGIGFNTQVTGAGILLTVSAEVSEDPY